MEKTNEIIRTIEEYEHLFYCDECGKHLGKSMEYDDGWYKRYGEFELQFYVADEWYRIEKCLCDDCRQRFISRVKTNLTNMGFEKY